MQPKDRRLVTEQNLENYTEAELAPLKSDVDKANSTSSQALSVSQQANQSSEHAVDRVEYIETVAGLAPGEVTDAQTANLISQPTTETRSALDEVVALRTKFSLAAGPASGLSVFTDSTRPYVIGRFGGYIWGVNGGRIWRSTNGVAWTDFAPGPGGSHPAIMYPVDGGEVVAATYNNVYKSSGWSTENVTWTEKLSGTGPTSSFQAFSLSASGNKVIAAEYSGDRVDSRYAWISLDSGDTWEVAYDAQERYTTAQFENTHIHGVAYDPWADRFYLSEGHGDVAGIYVSADDGATWTRPEGLVMSPAPTTLTATDDGLVCGSDSEQAGILGVIRQENFRNERFIETWRWRTGHPGVIGFATSGHRDPDTGVVYVSFRAVRAEVPPVIAGGTAGAAGLVYVWPDLPISPGDDIQHAIVAGSNIFAFGRINGESRHIIGQVAPPGTPLDDPDVRVEGSTMAVGPRASATSSNATAVGISASSGYRAVALGHTAEAGSDSVAIGDYAAAQVNSTAIGRNARTGAGANALAIGRNSSANGGDATAVGAESSAQTTGTAIGRGAKAEGSQSVAVGRNAVASGNNMTAFGDSAFASEGGDAFGRNARALHYQSLALGRNVETTANFQAHIGGRMVAAETISVPLRPPAGTGYLYFREHSGKVALYVRFPTGDEIRLAIEA